MTNRSSDRLRTRYFRSFSALRHPVEPIDEVELSETRELATYYEARYAEHTQLVEFIKHLRQVHDGSEATIVVFAEAYDYWDSGCLKKRTLSVPGQPDQTWSYADNEQRWSRYFDDLCARWFGARESAEPTLPEIALLLHEQFTELEAELFRTGIGAIHDNRWAFETNSRLLADVRRIVLEIEPAASPLICAVAGGKGYEIALKGFDEAPPNLYGVVLEWADSQTLPREHETVTLTPRIDFDPMGQQWAAESGIHSVTTASVLANAGGKTRVAFTAFLIARVELNPAQISLINSIFRRFVLVLQQIIESARPSSKAEHDAFEG